LIRASLTDIPCAQRFGSLFQAEQHAARHDKSRPLIATETVLDFVAATRT